MSGPLEGADGGGVPSPGASQHRPCPGPSLADDTDANSNGSSGNESNGHESRGASQRSSHSSSSGNGKDSALLETTESSKRCVRARARVCVHVFRSLAVLARYC